MIYDQETYRKLGKKETVSDQVHTAMTMIGEKQLDALISYQPEHHVAVPVDILYPFETSRNLFESYRCCYKYDDFGFLVKTKIVAIMNLLENYESYQVISYHYLLGLSYSELMNKFEYSKPTLIKKIKSGQSIIDKKIRADRALPLRVYPNGNQ